MPSSLEPQFLDFFQTNQASFQGMTSAEVLRLFTQVNVEGKVVNVQTNSKGLASGTLVSNSDGSRDHQKTGQGMRAMRVSVLDLQNANNW